MKRNILYISIVLIVVGLIGRLYAAQYTYVTPEGVLVDSAWLPIGTNVLPVHLHPRHRSPVQQSLAMPAYAYRHTDYNI